MTSKKMLKSVYIIIFILVLSFFNIACASKDNDEPEYSKAVAEDFLIAVSKSDYEAIADLLSDDFKKSLMDKGEQKSGEDKKYSNEKEAFINEICKPLDEKIGEYEKGSLVFKKTLKEKGYINVFYNTKFSKEAQGPVMAQFVFEEIDSNMLISGFWLSSKTLKQ